MAYQPQLKVILIEDQRWYLLTHSSRYKEVHTFPESPKFNVIVRRKFELLSSRPARICIHQLCADIGHNIKDLPGAIDDEDGWRLTAREQDRELLADSTT